MVSYQVNLWEKISFKISSKYKIFEKQNIIMNLKVCSNGCRDFMTSNGWLMHTRHSFVPTLQIVILCCCAVSFLFANVWVASGGWGWGGSLVMERFAYFDHWETHPPLVCFCSSYTIKFTSSDLELMSNSCMRLRCFQLRTAIYLHDRYE